MISIYQLCRRAAQKQYVGTSSSYYTRVSNLRVGGGQWIHIIVLLFKQLILLIINNILYTMGMSYCIE